MLNPILTKNFNAGAAVNAFRIVKMGADDNNVIQAAAATDALVGVSTCLAAASAEPVDVILSGVAEVTYGGNVTRGALLTSDANGKAVAAAPAAGANVAVIGRALVSGVDGDVGCVLLAPGQIQGA
jgi:hypothetical protein